MAALELHATTQDVIQITDTVFELKFSVDQPLSFRAGQFCSIVIPGKGPNGRDLRRAYSIASWPEKEHLELCIKLVPGGPGTEYLHSLKRGDTFKCFAPYGHLVYNAAPEKQVAFIATGTGVAPFRAIYQSEEFRKNPPAKTLFLFGAATQKEILYEKEIRSAGGAEWINCLSREKELSSAHFPGRVTDYLKKQADTFPWLETEYYLCGNGAMIDEVKKMLLEKGVDKKWIHQEVYYRPKT